MASSDDRLLTEREAADYLSTSARHVEKLRLSGDLAYVRIGGKVRLRRSDLLSYVESRVVA